LAVASNGGMDGSTPRGTVRRLYFFGSSTIDGGGWIRPSLSRWSEEADLTWPGLHLTRWQTYLLGRQTDGQAVSGATPSAEDRFLRFPPVHRAEQEGRKRGELSRWVLGQRMTGFAVLDRLCNVGARGPSGRQSGRALVSNTRLRGELISRVGEGAVSGRPFAFRMPEQCGSSPV
jgi:hypothetical protein